ncbi:hypothetical protein GmHk_19G056023 [Glycine max]|nr:hypothetical protein GmHk_19G056023 [Glycine max]
MSLLLTCLLRPVVTLKPIGTPTLRVNMQMMMLNLASMIVLRFVMLLNSMDMMSLGILMMMLKMRRKMMLFIMELHIVMMMICNTRSPVCLMIQAKNWWMRWKRTGFSGKLVWHLDYVCWKFFISESLFSGFMSIHTIIKIKAFKFDHISRLRSLRRFGKIEYCEILWIVCDFYLGKHGTGGCSRLNGQEGFGFSLGPLLKLLLS